MESVGSSVTASTSRNERPHKKQKDKDDIISELPDTLITHILSFLPTKDVVRTSVLSRRWIERWTLITKLDLDDSVFYSRKKKKSGGKQNFINFVNRALLLTNSYGMKSFSLVIANKYDVSLINAWISCILKRCVRKLRICSNLELPFSALTSHFLFNQSNSLEELVLEMCCCAIKIPPHSTYCYFVFGKLKVLKLCGIIFTIDKSQGIHFSVLKKFEAYNCSWSSAHDVTLELKAPLLESILIDEDLESVTLDPRSLKLKFSASCMKRFTYSGYGGILKAIILSDPSAARNAFANIILYKSGNRETGSCVSLLLKQFSQVKCIKFQGSEVLTKQNVAVLPKFAMLSHLELGSVSVEILLGLLQKSPILNTLAFKEISKFDQELLNSAAVPDCLASTLQVVKFGYVHGSEDDLLLAKFFMENGIVLERMSFSLKRMWSKSKLIEEFKEKLYSFKKGVSFAILEFHYLVAEA